MKRTLIQNAVIVNEGRKVLGSVVIEGEKIAEILTGEEKTTTPCDEIIDATGCYLLPGAIDEHVHFRDPGLTHKADITTESRAAAAGGVTSIMDMPNTNPQTTTLEALDEKLALLAGKSAVNYSCYFGATNNNYPQFAQLDKHRVCGVKLFMGSSTGNMLVDRMASLRNIFGGTDLLIAAHCEDQGIIKENTDKYKKAYGDDVPLTLHPVIRSEEACYRSSELAVQLAREANARLHIMHISTAKELSLFSNVPLAQKRITAEACVSHLLFTEEDYQRLMNCGYEPASYRKTDAAAAFDSLFFMNLELTAEELKERTARLFEEPGCGHILRVKGFVKAEDGRWLELNATRREQTLAVSPDGQEVLIVIGEQLSKETIGRILKGKN